MKSFKKYFAESARSSVFPIKEDRFDFYIDALLCIESKVLAHTDTSITVTVDNTAMSMLESLDLLEAINHLERRYDLDLFKDMGDGYWVGSQQHNSDDVKKVDYSLYRLENPEGLNDKFVPAWEFINYLSVSSYNPSSSEIEQAAKNLKAQHQSSPDNATLKVPTAEVAKKQRGPNSNISPMAEDAYDSVKDAITHRIAVRHMDLLTKYGIDKVEDAIDSVADFHRDVEEIGSSDISAFVRQVQDTLGHIAEMRRLSGFQIAETVIDQAAIDAFVAKHTANEGDVVAFKRPELKGDAPNLGRAKELARELYWKETSSRNTPEELKAEEDLRNQLAKIGFSAETDFDLEEGENIVLTHKASGKQYPVTGDDLFVEGAIREAKYQGRKVALGKPMRGDVAKFKVYVKDPKTGNVKKVNFGDKDMEIKRDNPARRKNFRARHNCAGKKDRTKAGYWSCRMWSGKPVGKILESFAKSKVNESLVHFVVNSEKSMQAVMAQFGDRINWDGDDMTVDAKFWPQVERVAGDADPSPSGGADRIEDLDEISKATLGSYVKKAKNDVAFHSRQGGWSSAKADELGYGKRDFRARPWRDEDDDEYYRHTDSDHYHRTKGDKRRAGIDKAVDKLTKEDAQVKKMSEAKAPSVISKIQDNIIGIDQLSRNRTDNTLIFRRGFYYRHGGTAESFAKKISDDLTKLGIKHQVVDRGQVDKPFRGGAGVKANSHWWVKIKIDEQTPAGASANDR